MKPNNCVSIISSNGHLPSKDVILFRNELIRYSLAFSVKAELKQDFEVICTPHCYAPKHILFSILASQYH